MTELLQRPLEGDTDVIMAQREARDVAESLGFSRFEITRIATAISEIGRNAVVHGGGGSLRIHREDDVPPRMVVEVLDRGPGFADLAAVLAGRHRSATGMGVGIAGSRRLMDSFEVDREGGQTVVRMTKRLPGRDRRAEPPAAREVAARPRPTRGPVDWQAEVQQRERALLEREQLIAHLKQELEDTNRGVLALYAELDERADYERRAKELKARLVSEMGHELRTPLHSLVSISGFLRDRLDGPLTDEQARQVQILRDTAVGLTHYVNDLLDLARAEAGRAEVKPSSFSLAKAFAALRHLMQPLATDEAVALRIDAPPPDLWLETDEGKVSQILRNLVSNALKFTERGEVRVTAGLDPRRDEVTLQVADTGIGIASADHALIFEEYAQVDSPRQRRLRGSGLGLPLSQRLATLLGGRIELESTPGVGSTFRAVLPRRYRGEPAHVDEPLPEPPPPAVRWVPERRRILVIDDDPASQYVLGRVFPSHFDVQTAARGREGLEQAIASPPDVVFLDLIIPDLPGLEVLSGLRTCSATATVPVVIYTSLALGEGERQRLAPANAIVRKATGAPARDQANLYRACVEVGLAE